MLQIMNLALANIKHLTALAISLIVLSLLSACSALESTSTDSRQTMPPTVTLKRG